MTTRSTRSTAAHASETSTMTARFLASVSAVWADTQYANRRIFELNTRI